MLTAVAAGHVTVTAGSASADMTVSAVALPLGTVIWLNPGNGSGVYSIVPAVPSSSGVADVFAFQNDGTVQAIASDGTTAWTANVGCANGNQYPTAADFQGGLVAMQGDCLNPPTSIVKFDGLTGLADSTYTPAAPWGLPGTGQGVLGRGLAVHTDGTIFTILENTQTESALIVAGIDPTTGTQKFIASLRLLDPNATTFALGLVIAGDGYAYVPYYNWLINYDESGDLYDLHVLRVSSSGAYDDIPVLDWVGPFSELPDVQAKVITNADTGTVLTWTEAGQQYMAVTAGTSATLVNAPTVANQSGPVEPVLQAQDGSFVGTAWDQTFTPYMLSFDASGNVRWSVANEYPQIATEDGGVIALDGNTGSALTFDQNGSATGRAALSTPSWKAQSYVVSGGVADVAQTPPQYASSFEPAVLGNLSENATSVPFLAFVEGLPLFASGGGSTCRLSSNKAPLAGTVLQQYTSAKQALLAGNYLTSEACSTFFNARGRASYFTLLTSAVTNQVPYDGNQTTISMYTAGLWVVPDENKPTFPSVWKKTAVCQNFTPGIVAEAQTQLPANDVYINSNAKVSQKYLTQSTILHEALHGITGMNDSALAEILGTHLTATGASSPINAALVNNGCAAN